MLTGTPSTEVEVEAAQEVLVGLAVAAVLGDREPGHRLEHFRGAQQRAVPELILRHRTLARRLELAASERARCGHDYLLERAAARLHRPRGNIMQQRSKADPGREPCRSASHAPCYGRRRGVDAMSRLLHPARPPIRRAGCTSHLRTPRTT